MGAKRSSGRRLVLSSPLSLRSQVAFTIGILSAVPSLVMLSVLLAPNFRAGEATLGVAGPIALLWLGIVVLLSGVVGYVLSKALLAPLLQTASDVRALDPAADHPVSTRLPVVREDPPEVRSLRQSFNELLFEVELAQSRRNAVTAALMHDLKTPLVAANNGVAIARGDAQLSPEQRDHLLEQVGAELQGLIELVQRLVDMHRLEREAVPLTLESVEMHTLVSRVVERLAPISEERGVAVEVSGEGRATVDPREIERALYNLVSNAVRYARSNIRIEVYPGLVRVQDDGPGLPSPLEELAEPFVGHHHDIAGNTYLAGTGGLGLFIARRVLELHGGRLVCEGTGPSGTILLAFVGAKP